LHSSVIRRPVLAVRAPRWSRSSRGSHLGSPSGDGGRQVTAGLSDLGGREPAVDGWRSRGPEVWAGAVAGERRGAGGVAGAAFDFGEDIECWSECGRGVVEGCSPSL